MKALSDAYNKPAVVGLSRKAKFRNPDRLANAEDELLKIIPEYQKVSGARAIAPYINIAGNLSHSFNVFIKTIRTFA